jgi:hypothetical protein
MGRLLRGQEQRGAAAEGGMMKGYPIIERLSDRERQQSPRPSYHVSSFENGHWVGKESTFDFDKAVKLAKGFAKGKVEEFKR